MKKLIAILLCSLMLLTAAACKTEDKPETPANVDETPAEPGETESEPIAEPRSGGWTIAEDPSLTDELRAIYEKGLSELVGVN